jgi:hypothetical protein
MRKSNGKDDMGRYVYKDESRVSASMHSIHAFTQYYAIEPGSSLERELKELGQPTSGSVFCFHVGGLVFLFSYNPRFPVIEILCKDEYPLSLKNMSYYDPSSFPQSIKIEKVKHIRNFRENSARGERLKERLRRDYTSAYMSLLGGDLGSYSLTDTQREREAIVITVLKTENATNIVSQFLGHEETLLQCSVVVDQYPITRGWYKYGHSMTLIGEYGYHVWNLFRDTRGLYVRIDKVMFHVRKGTMVLLQPEFSLDHVEDLLNIRKNTKTNNMIGDKHVTTIPRVTFGASSPVE